MFETSGGFYRETREHLKVLLLGGPCHGETRERTKMRIGSMVVVPVRVPLSDIDLTQAGAEYKADPVPRLTESYFPEFITNGTERYWYLRHESVSGEDSVSLLLKCLSEQQEVM